MAKDKTKKSGDDDFGRPSDAPATGDSWRAEHVDNVGRLMLITPLREEDFKSEDYGDSRVVVADVVVLNEKKPEKSETHEEVFFFGGWTKGALRGYIGERRVLARLERDQSKSKSKSNPAWVLEDGDADDVKVAKAYLASVDPFEQKGGKSKPEPEPKKGKGGKKK